MAFFRPDTARFFQRRKEYNRSLNQDLVCQKKALKRSLANAQVFLLEAQSNNNQDDIKFHQKRINELTKQLKELSK